MGRKKYIQGLPQYVSPVKKKGKIAGYKYQRRIPKDLQEFYLKDDGVQHYQVWDLYLGNDLLQAIIKAHELRDLHDQQIATVRNPAMLAQAAVTGFDKIAANKIAEQQPQTPRWQDTGTYLETSAGLPYELELQSLAVFAATAFGDASYVETIELSPTFAEFAKAEPVTPPSGGTDLLTFTALKGALDARLKELEAKKVVPEDERLSGRLEKYIEFNGTSDNTARSYRTRVNRFIEYLGDDRALDGVSDDDIRNYRDYLRAGCEKYAPMEVSGVQQYLNVLKALYNWAVEEKKASSNPLANIRSLPNKKSVEETRWVAFTANDMAQIWPAVQSEWGPDSKSKLSPQRRKVFLAVFKLLLWTGMRPNEVFKLLPEQVERDRIHIKKTKTAAARILPLTPANADFHDLIRSDTWRIALSNEKGTGLRKDIQKVMSEGFSEIIRAIGITNDRKVLYSTKDTLLDELEALGASENTQRTIIGHKTGRGALRNYKEPAKFEVMKSVLEQVNYCAGLP